MAWLSQKPAGGLFAWYSQALGWWIKAKPRFPIAKCVSTSWTNMNPSLPASCVSTWEVIPHSRKTPVASPSRTNRPPVTTKPCRVSQRWRLWRLWRLSLALRWKMSLGTSRTWNCLRTCRAENDSQMAMDGYGILVHTVKVGYIPQQSSPWSIILTHRHLRSICYFLPWQKHRKTICFLDTYCMELHYYTIMASWD